MNTKLVIFGLVLITLNLEVSRADQFRCLGSDGGTPFTNISQDVTSSQKIIQTQGLVKDYVYHQGLEQIVYRNERNQIRTFNLRDSRDHFISYSNAKFSRVVQNDLGRILTSNSTYYLDTAVEPFWYSYGYPNRVVEHLFADKEDIYSLEGVWQEDAALGINNAYQFSFLTYESGRLWRRSCRTPGKIGINLKLAKGNQFPFVYFTVVKKGLLEDKVMVYRMSLKQVGAGGVCPLQEMTTYPFANVGSVKNFYYFNIDGVDAYAFHLDDPKRNLFWDKPGECAYYNFNGRTPIYISPKYPVFASWQNGKGLSLHNLKTRTETSFFNKMTQNQLSTENLWLAEDGKTLYSSLTPSKAKEQGRLIVSTKIKE